MKTYLLKAPQDSLARWKSLAAKRGLTFAEYIRRALDAYEELEPASISDSPRATRAVHTGFSGAHVEGQVIAPTESPFPPLDVLAGVHPALAGLGKRSYAPDFKKEKK